MTPNSPFEDKRKEYPIEYFIINLMKMKKRTNVAAKDQKNMKELQKSQVPQDPQVLEKSQELQKSLLIQESQVAQESQVSQRVEYSVKDRRGVT